MFSIPFEFLIPYEDASLRQDLIKQLCEVKTKQELSELISRYGIDAVKYMQIAIERQSLFNFSSRPES